MAQDATRNPTSSSGRLAAWGVVLLTLATVLLGALLPADRPAGSSAAPAADAGCLEWSDGCQVCQRLAEGPACSLPGIACTPGEPRCLRRGG